MLKERERNWIQRLRLSRYRNIESDIAFKNVKKMPGFTEGKIYRPFAYSTCSDGYTDFAILDNLNQVLYMEKGLMRKKFFSLVYRSSLVKNEYLECQEEMVKEMYLENDYAARYGEKKGK